jgi:hypothetical protein
LMNSQLQKQKSTPWPVSESEHLTYVKGHLWAFALHTCAKYQKYEEVVQNWNAPVFR